jgi:hypothetical protein
MRLMPGARRGAPGQNRIPATYGLKQRYQCAAARQHGRHHALPSRRGRSWVICTRPPTRSPHGPSVPRWRSGISEIGGTHSAGVDPCRRGGIQPGQRATASRSGRACARSCPRGPEPGRWQAGWRVSEEIGARTRPGRPRKGSRCQPSPPGGVSFVAILIPGPVIPPDDAVARQAARPAARSLRLGRAPPR